MLPAKAPGQNSIGTGGQDSIGANRIGQKVFSRGIDKICTLVD